MINYRILVVEDEQDLAELLKINLESEGYKVTLAPHGAVAINKLKTESFDLIIMDIMMPSMDGLTATHHIRLSSNNVPILILSAGSTAQDLPLIPNLSFRPPYTDNILRKLVTQ